MVDRILEQSQAIRHVLSDDRRNNLSLTWQDTDVLRSIHAALKPVSDLTDVLSGENYVTSSSILPMLQLCKDSVLAVSDDDAQLTNSIRTGILAKLEAKYASDSVRKLIRKCTFLDPRYRGGYESDTALAETKSELEAEMVVLNAQAAAPVGIRVEEEEEQPAPKKKNDSRMSASKKSRCAGTSGRFSGAGRSRDVCLLPGTCHPGRRRPPCVVEARRNQAISTDVKGCPQVLVHLCHKLPVRAGFQYSGQSCTSPSCLAEARKGGYVGVFGKKH